MLNLLEKEVKVTTFELDKYKLLVNESDVMNNLLLKLDNKMANTQNSMQIMQLKQIKLANANKEAPALNTSLNEEIVIIEFI